MHRTLHLINDPVKNDLSSAIHTSQKAKRVSGEGTNENCMIRLVLKINESCLPIHRQYKQKNVIRKRAGDDESTKILQCYL